MTKGSKCLCKCSKTVAKIGYTSRVPVKTTVSFKGGKGKGKGGGGGEGSYENKSRVGYYNKKSGSYKRTTTTEKASAGVFQRKNGTTKGTKSEYKRSSTVRTGDKRGYTEVYNEQRVRNVSYNNKSSSNTKRVTYNKYDGGSYGCYGCDSSSESDSDSSDSDSESASTSECVELIILGL